MATTQTSLSQKLKNQCNMIGSYVVKEGTVKNTLKLVILTICFDGYGKNPILLYIYIRPISCNKPVKYNSIFHRVKYKEDRILFGRFTT